MIALTEQEVLDVLHAVERGEVTLDPEDVALAQSQYTGILRFRLSSGWVMTVFNDCREWDYIERMETSDGRVLTYDELSDRMPELESYKPSNPALWGLDR